MFTSYQSVHRQMEKLKEPNIGTHKSHCFRVDVYYVCDLEILEPCWDREGIQPQLDLGVRIYGH